MVGYIHVRGIRVEARRSPGDRGPLALAEDGRIADCNRAAAASGVRAGMRVREAVLHAPQLLLVGEPVGNHVRRLFDAGLALSPRVEPRGEAAMWLDLAADPDPRGVMARLARQVVPALGHAADWAVAPTRFEARARVEAGAGPAVALADLPVACLWPLRAQTRMQIRGLGLEVLGDIARLPAGTLAGRWGAEGACAERLARGEDATPVASAWPPPQWRWERRWESPVDTLAPLQRAFDQAANALGEHLGRHGQVAHRLQLEVLFPGGQWAQARRELPLGVRGPVAAGVWRGLLRRVPAGPIEAVTLGADMLGPDRARPAGLFGKEGAVPLPERLRGRVWTGKGISPREARLLPHDPWRNGRVRG